MCVRISEWIQMSLSRTLSFGFALRPALALDVALAAAEVVLDMRGPSVRRRVGRRRRGCRG